MTQNFKLCSTEISERIFRFVKNCRYFLQHLKDYFVGRSSSITVRFTVTKTCSKTKKKKNRALYIERRRREKKIYKTDVVTPPPPSSSSFLCNNFVVEEKKKEINTLPPSSSCLYSFSQCVKCQNK